MNLLQCSICFFTKNPPENNVLYSGQYSKLLFLAIGCTASYTEPDKNGLNPPSCHPGLPKKTNNYQKSSPKPFCKTTQNKLNLACYLLLFRFTSYFHIFFKKKSLTTLWHYRYQYTMNANNCICWTAQKNIFRCVAY